MHQTQNGPEPGQNPSTGGLQIDPMHKRVVLIGLALILVVIAITIFRSFSSPQTKQSIESDVAATDQINTISAQDVRKKMASKEQVVFLDIRTADEYTLEHITDSRHVTQDNQEVVLSQISKDAFTVVVSEGVDDQNNIVAAELLKQKGLAKFAVLGGGIAAWKSGGGDTISVGVPTSIDDQAKVNYASVDDLKKAIDDRKAISVIDVRTPEYFSQGHIRDSLNIPLDQLEQRRKEISSSKAVFVIGGNELDEFQAAVRIYDIFMTPAFVVQKGILEWQDKGFELVE